MSQNEFKNLTNKLCEASLRYPEKTFFLGQVFNNTTNSYKLFWFLGLLNIIKRGTETTFPLNDIFREMVVVAWHPVCFYRLSLGRQDKLQDAILEIKQDSGLPPNTELADIHKYLESSNKVQTQLENFGRYVPTRFLTPWFSNQLRGIQDDLRRTRQIELLAAQGQNTPLACPYYFDISAKKKLIKLNKSWCIFIIENLGVIQSFAEYHLVQYLQAKNPNTPGIINKLQAPTERQLTFAREFWRVVRADFINNSKAEHFKDIYLEKPIGNTFSIDHFLPWSFVAHDLLWNLTPVEKTTNSRKGDSIPELNLYLPRLAQIHRESIVAIKKRPRFLEDYTEFFKQDAPGLLSLSEEAFITKYREIVMPQAQIAINQGFEGGWIFQR
jgi:hypothetical protein